MSSAAPTARDVDTAYAYRKLPLLAIRESKLNPRTHFHKEGLEELAASIKQLGVLTPLLVRPVGDRYEIAAGHRRFRSAKMAGLEFVPCIVRDLTDVELLEILVVENNQRENVHPLEEGAGYKALLDLGAYSVEGLAQKIGRSRIYVYDRLKLLELGRAGRDLFLSDRISFAHARLISRLPEEDQAKVIGETPANPEFFPAGGLFELDDAEAGADEPAAMKTRSVREVSEWIDENCRIDPQAENLEELFPETASAIDAAAEKEEKVVRITRLYQLPPTARGGDPVLTERSWKRADGKKDVSFHGQDNYKSKVCEVAVTGVIVIGPGRGDSLKVCVDKDCNTHWGAEQREKAKRANAGDSFAKQDAARAAKYKAEAEKADRERLAWSKAGPELLELLGEKVAAAKGLGQVGELVFTQIVERLTPSERAAARDAAPKGKTAEALLKQSAVGVLAGLCFDGYNGPRRLPKVAKAFGVDVAAIIKKHTAPAPAKKAAAK